jgi:hypothetical protein
MVWPVLDLRTGLPGIAIIPADQNVRASYVSVVAGSGPGALDVDTGG